MIQYFDNGDIACYNGYSFRRDKNTGYYLSAKPINGRRKRLHVYVWEHENGEIPEGYDIHHKDKDKSNNEIENLELITRSEHLSLHGKDKAGKMREKLMKYAVPEATKWHKSEEGRKWHSEHSKKMMENRKPEKYICTYCGKEYESKKIRKNNTNNFCSNKCKSAYRRDMGFDNVKRICKVCGSEFYANKYQNITRCENCRRGENRK